MLRKLNKPQKAFLWIVIYESIYLTYTYLVADPFSLKLGADGFIKTKLSLEIFIFSVLIIPPLEELLCRSFLNKELRHIWVFPLFLSFSGLIFYFFYSKIFMVFAILVLATIILRLFISVNKIKVFLKKNFIIFFYLSSFLFAFVHIPSIHSKMESLILIHSF